MRHGTYSIVARDPETGELGVAVQSHWFSVGSLCTWARPGVGAVATQSIAEPAYGPRARPPRRGRRAGEALGGAARRRPRPRVRQVAVVDARGRRRRPHRRGLHPVRRPRDRRALRCQANMMAARRRCRRRWPPRSSAPTGHLAGGCWRRSTAPRPRAATCAAASRAALLVVPAEGEPGSATSTCASRTTPSRWPSSAPADLQRAYELAGEGDELLAAGRDAEAGEPTAAPPSSRPRPRAAVLGRPGPRQARRPRGRRRGRAARDRGAARLAGAARPPAADFARLGAGVRRALGQGWPAGAQQITWRWKARLAVRRRRVARRRWSTRTWLASGRRRRRRRRRCLELPTAVAVNEHLRTSRPNVDRVASLAAAACGQRRRGRPAVGAQRAGLVDRGERAGRRVGGELGRVLAVDACRR